jgi:hypothetical protein
MQDRGTTIKHKKIDHLRSFRFKSEFLKTSEDSGTKLAAGTHLAI